MPCVQINNRDTKVKKVEKKEDKKKKVKIIKKQYGVLLEKGKTFKEWMEFVRQFLDKKNP